MATTTHPFDPSITYEMIEEGNIRLSQGDKFGIFTNEGRHISGEIREADPQLCVWVGNNPIPSEIKVESHFSPKQDV